MFLLKLITQNKQTNLIDSEYEKNVSIIKRKFESAKIPCRINVFKPLQSNKMTAMRQTDSQSVTRENKINQQLK